MLSEITTRLRALFSKRAVEGELDDELRFHLEHAVTKHMASGVDRAEAERRARIELGGVEAVKEDCRDERGVGLLEAMGADLRYGARVLRKSPGFTAVAILTLALGIGANTALFSVVNGVLLHPLPFPDANALVALSASKPGFERGSISYPNFRDWKRMNRSFTALTMYRGNSANLTGLGTAEQVRLSIVSADFFTVLGIQPIMGRGFAAGEDEVGAAPLVVVSTGFWERKLGGSADAIGKTVVLDGSGYTVVGVAPATFDIYLGNSRKTDIFFPVGQWKNNLLTDRGAGLGIRGIGRLAPGVTLENARADMNTVTRALAEEYPSVNKSSGAGLVPLVEAAVGDLRPFLLVLFGAVGLVLLVACVNVANLLLARATGRSREIAIRLALGASRGRLIRQLLTESVLLALIGGVLGVVLAAWGTGALLAIVPMSLPNAAAIRLDAHVLLFTGAVSLAAGILFGLVPALSAARRGVHDTLKQGGRGATASRHRTQSVFVVVETALAIVLLVGAGLMVRSLVRLFGVDPGFTTHGVLAFSVSPVPALKTAPPDAVRTTLRELERSLASEPGVSALGLSIGAIPLVGDDETRVWPFGQPKPQNQNDMAWALSYVVTPGYFDVLQISLLRGRLFSTSDDEHAPLVAVVDEEFARKNFADGDALGKRVMATDRDAPLEIVGVVGHVNQWGLDRDETTPVRSQMYRPFAQLPNDGVTQAASGVDVLVRSPTKLSSIADAMRARVARIDADQVVYEVTTMDDVVSESLATRRFAVVILGGFAGLALLLAGIGIYGVLSYIVGQRTHEIGVRVALGARRPQILGLIVGQGARMVLVGILAGLGAAWASTRVMASVLYGVGTTDPLTFTVVAAAVTVIALAACALPALRASRVDPMRALRLD